MTEQQLLSEQIQAENESPQQVPYFQHKTSRESVLLARLFHSFSMISLAL